MARSGIFAPGGGAFGFAPQAGQQFLQRADAHWIELAEFQHAPVGAVPEGLLQEHFKVQTKSLCFCGHTHVPTVWHLSNTGNIKSWRGHGRIELPAGGKTLVNVGSVGQPRDLCSAACYAICDPQARWVEFRRVAYDIAKARRKIVRAQLPRYTAQRLSLGR